MRMRFDFFGLCICITGVLAIGVTGLETEDIYSVNNDQRRCSSGSEAVDMNFDEGMNGDIETSHQYEAAEVEYTAAVLEYEAFDDLSEGGFAVIQENARILLEYASQASQQGADIIVFPEYGLTSTSLGSTIEVFLSQTQIVPGVEEEAVPCYYTDVNNYTQVMKDLSCGALELGMYFVVDLAEQVQCYDTTPVSDVNSRSPVEAEEEPARSCPDSGYLFYNTQVVFDHLGTVIARYRKKHLFLEPYFTQGDQPDEEATFVTHFGVTFTLQICFDIMYQSPAVNNIDNLGIRDVAMSTAWIDELPFLTAPQIWKGWSEGLKVNLLVANYHSIANGELGSGIFRGVTSEKETYTYSATAGTTLLVGNVSTTTEVNSTKADDVNTAKHLSQGRGFHQPKCLGGYSDDSDDSNAWMTSVREPSRERGGGSGLKIAENQTFIHEDLGDYNSTILERSTTELIFISDLCHADDFCCMITYTYRYNETEEGLYKLFVYSGVVEKGGGVYAMYTQTCSVVYCLNNDTESCARIEGEELKDSSLRVYELDGYFAGSYVYPSVFTQNLELVDPSIWNFSIDQHPDYYYGSLKLEEKVENLLSLTMFSRWYSMDP